MGNIVIGLYKRKFFFFLAVGLIITGVIFYLRNQGSEASLVQAPVSTPQIAQNLQLEIQKNGQVLVAGKRMSGLIKHYQDHDQLKFVAFDEAGYFLNQLKVTVKLPQPVAKTAVKPGIYAIHGVNSYQSFQEDAQTLVYHGYGLAPTATFTITADLPPGLLNFPWYQRMVFSLESLPFYLWLGLTAAFPLLTLLVLLWMMIRSLKEWKNSQSKDVLAQPPQDLAPAVAGVLLDGKVSGRLIAATLMDLARRGYLEIIRKEGEFAFIKKSSWGTANIPDTGLRSFEKTLLSKIFSPTSARSTTGDIQMRIGQHVFSRKVAEIYWSIYEEVTNRGFFRQNPSQFHKRYYLTGLGLFFLGLAGFILGIFFFPEPKFLLLVWFGMVLSALVIIKLAPRLPSRTPDGQQQSSQWLKFKNFLTLPEPLASHDDCQGIFEKYLPYAIALGAEDQWTGRFMTLPFRSPEWFIATSPVFILEDFASSLFPLISYISQELVRSHEPVVE